MRRNNRSNYKKNTFKKRTRRGIIKPNFAIARFKAPKNYGQTIKTLDTQFISVYANPFVVDQLQPGQLNIDTLGTIQNLATIQQGPNIAQRIGNKIGLKSLRLRFDIGPIGRNVPQESSARMMVVYDRNPNGSYPLISQMLAASRQDGTTNAGTMWSSVNCNLLDRFVVLMDEFLILPAFHGAGINSTQVIGPTTQDGFRIDKYIKLKGLETVFNNTSNPLTIANVQIGALYLVSWGNVAAAASAWSWVGETRLRFQDN
jgi:hypothetical protein